MPWKEVSGGDGDKYVVNLDNVHRMVRVGAHTNIRFDDEQQTGVTEKPEDILSSVSVPVVP